ncbi:MAG: transglutaminase family protein [Phycisphaerales bacterium]|nr:transglutaminase family protein [Phycisphaerales bacterium]
MFGITSALCCLQLASAQIIDPEGPLVRSGARHQVLQFQVSIGQLPQSGTKRPFKMPFIVDGPWSVVDPETLRVRVFAGSKPIADVFGEALAKPDALGSLMLKAPMTSEPLLPLVVTVDADVIGYSSEFDESVAGQIPWPAAWPAPVKEELGAEPLIETDSTVVKAAMESTVGEKPSDWGPPLAVAKRLIQAACTSLNQDGQHLFHGPGKTIRGINVRGAEWTLLNGGGSRADLTCVCVALLRAAGIPARPVIAVGSDSRSRDDGLIVRGEFFLPEAGWVPFDASELKRLGVGTKRVTDPWAGLGTFRDLDEIIPLAWTFAPDDGRHAYEAWAVWSWTRLLPDDEFPRPIKTSAIEWGNQVVATSRTMPGSNVSVRRWSKGPLQSTGPSPWRAAP